MPTFNGPLTPTWNGVTTGVQVVPSSEYSALMFGLVPIVKRLSERER